MKSEFVCSLGFYDCQSCLNLVFGYTQFYKNVDHEVRICLLMLNIV